MRHRPLWHHLCHICATALSEDPGQVSIDLRSACRLAPFLPSIAYAGHRPRASPAGASGLRPFRSSSRRRPTRPTSTELLFKFCSTARLATSRSTTRDAVCCPVEFPHSGVARWSTWTPRAGLRPPCAPSRSSLLLGAHVDEIEGGRTLVRWCAPVLIHFVEEPLQGADERLQSGGARDRRELHTRTERELRCRDVDSGDPVEP